MHVSHELHGLGEAVADVPDREVEPVEDDAERGSSLGEYDLGVSPGHQQDKEWERRRFRLCQQRCQSVRLL